jgi:hypothetical protein
VHMYQERPVCCYIFRYLTDIVNLLEHGNKSYGIDTNYTCKWQEIDKNACAKGLGHTVYSHILKLFYVCSLFQGSTLYCIYCWLTWVLFCGGSDGVEPAQCSKTGLIPLVPKWNWYFSAKWYLIPHSQWISKKQSRKYLVNIGWLWDSTCNEKRYIK